MDLALLMASRPASKRDLAQFERDLARTAELKARGQAFRKIAAVDPYQLWDQLGREATLVEAPKLAQEQVSGLERDTLEISAPAPAPDRVVSNGPLARVLRAEARAQGLERDRNDRRRYLGQLLGRRYDQALDCWVLG